MIAELKNSIDLAEVVRKSGIELNDRGWGLCPLHTEKTPSFKVDSDRQRWYCFAGCGGGDCIDFTQKYHGVDFKTALQILGIDTRRQKITPQMRKELQQRKHRADLVKRFRRWEVVTSNKLSFLIRNAHRLLSSIKTPADFERYGNLYHPLPVWECQFDILCSGNDKLKFEFYQEA
nr:hypothetical protein [Bacteroidota bacterium]